MAAKGGECSAVQPEFHSISSQDDREEEEQEPTFIEQPPDRFNCLICHCVMREPHIVMCCSRKMCRDCIQRVHLSGQPCPNCREPNFSIFLEKQLNSEILDLRVRCTHYNNGCEWVGELRDLKKHTNPVDGSCGFVQVKCPFGCPVAYLHKDTIDHESVCTNLPPEKQIKRTIRVTDQFKEELQATLSQFQELYKSESARVKELTTQLEDMKEKMKYQFEAEKKQLLEDSKQQIALLSEGLIAEFNQQMKIKNEEYQQQMMQLHKEFEKKERERSEAVKKQLAELKEKEKQIEVQFQKQLINIKDKLSNELKELYHNEHKQRIEKSKEESKVVHNYGRTYGRTFTGLSKDVLLLMPKVREDCSKNMQFFPKEGKVVVLASSEKEREQCITQLQNSYQEIIKNRQFKSGDLEIPPAFQIENMFGLLEEFDTKYSQCHFSCDEKARVVRIVSMSSRQFDQAKKLLGDRLAGEKCEEKTGKRKKNEKGGGGGKDAGATGVKRLLPPGSPAPLPHDGNRKITPNSDDDKIGCSICLNEVATDPVIMNCCSKVFCRLCIDKVLEHSSLCPNCRVAVRQVKGNQPPGTMGHSLSHLSLPGYEGSGTIVIKYSIPGGTQTNEHPNPGQQYHGTTREAYLPNTPEGQEVLQLLKKAFDARLIFTVGTSHTTGTNNAVVWNDIHHKTLTHGDPYGYPDPTYLIRVKEELKAKGIQ